MKVLVTGLEGQSMPATTRYCTVSSARAGLCHPLGDANWSQQRPFSHKVLWVLWEWLSQTRTQEPVRQHCTLWALWGSIKDMPETFLKTLVSLLFTKPAAAVVQALECWHKILQIAKQDSVPHSAPLPAAKNWGQMHGPPVCFAITFLQLGRQGSLTSFCAGTSSNTSSRITTKCPKLSPSCSNRKGRN